MNRENERTISGNQCDDATLDTGDVRGGGEGGRGGHGMHALGRVRAVGAGLVTQPGPNSRVQGGE